LNILREHYGQTHLSVRQILTDPLLFLAFGFGSGLVKKAPGTMGTLAAIPVYLLCIQTGVWIYSALTLIALFAGIWICDRAAKKLDEHDFNGIVWDEIAGYLITMWFVPLSWSTLIVGFILFRGFDIVKPQPIRWVDAQVSGGLGIMLDDVLAGIFAGGLLWLSVAIGWLN
jgi:phosphatidylglycerophosphatase A